MNIYPYVYRLDHPETGEFYIGVRWANKVPSNQDIGYKYFTSSKYVKPRFHEFECQIIAEFFDKQDAFNFEQELITENWNNPNKLNMCLQDHIKGVKFVNKIPWNKGNKKVKPKKNKKFGNDQLVCRLFDRRIMDIGNFTRWLKYETDQSFRDKIDMSYSKRIRRPFTEEQLAIFKEAATTGKVGQSLRRKVCRLIDRKEMDIGNYVQWERSISSTSSYSHQESP